MRCMGARRMLSDRQWKLARCFLFGEPGKPGRNAVDNRGKLEGMLWVFRAGAPWRDIPPEFGGWSNIYHTFRRWAKLGVFLQMVLALVRGRDLKVVMVDGTFIKVHKHGAGAPRGSLTPEESQVAQAIGRSRGGLTIKLMTLVDRRGRLVALSLVPGNADEGRQLAGLLDGVDVASIEELLGDKAFDRDLIREMLAVIRVKGTIPWKRNRKNPHTATKPGTRERKLKLTHAASSLYNGVASGKITAQSLDRLVIGSRLLTASVGYWAPGTAILETVSEFIKNRIDLEKAGSSRIPA